VDSLPTFQEALLKKMVDLIPQEETDYVT
jgi:hypothetical protein